MFAVNMFLERPVATTSCTTWSPTFEQDRTIALAPGQLDDAGRHTRADGSGATTWRPNGTAPTSPSPTTGAGPQEFRDTVGVPVFGEDFIEAVVGDAGPHRDKTRLTAKARP